MKQIKYTVNLYVAIRKAGLKKYLIKQGIISSKSFILEIDDLIDANIKLLNQIAIGESVEIDLFSNYSTELPIYANINIFVVTDINRFLWKYGERGYRFSNIDCGILSQNISLLSTYLGLGSCMIVAFVDDAVSKNLNLDQTELPLLGIPVGGITYEWCLHRYKTLI